MGGGTASKRHSRVIFSPATAVIFCLSSPSPLPLIVGGRFTVTLKSLSATPAGDDAMHVYVAASAN